MLSVYKFKSLLRAALVFSMLSCVQTSYASISCSSLLQQDTAQQIVLPRDLRVDADSARIILGGEHKEALEVTSRLFESLQDPVLLNQIAHSFREHTYNENPAVQRGLLGRAARALVGKSTEKSFSSFKDEAPAFLKRLDLSEEDWIKLWNIDTAIAKNLDSGFMQNRNQRYLLSLFLSKTITESSFSNSTRRGFVEYAVEDFANEVTVSTPVIVNTARLRSIVNELIHDRGFVDTLGEEMQALRDEGLNSLVSKFGRASYTLRTDKKAEMLVAIVLNGLFRHPAENRNTAGRGLKIIFTGERRVYLEELESFLLKNLSDTTLAEPVVELMDRFLFKVPLPADAVTLSKNIIDGASSYWLLGKAEASRIKGDETLAAVAHEQSQISVREYVPIFLSRPVEISQRRNPNKRDRRRSSEGDDGRVDVDQPVIEQNLVFEEGLVPEAGVEYEFNFVRNPGFGVQKITFAEEVVKEMETQRINWKTFLTPINNGFTAVAGQNGVKRMGAQNRSIRDNLYEVRPGRHAFRMLMLKDGNNWSVVRLIHHDQVQRIIENI